MLLSRLLGRVLNGENTMAKFLGKPIKPEHKFRNVIGLCPACGRRERVNRTGLMAAHKVHYQTDARCIGTGQQPSKIVAQYDY